MNRLSILGIALLTTVLTAGVARESNAQVVYRVARPVVVAPGYYTPYAPTYYYGGWYPGSYQNIYGNYGSYHVMQPVWPGGYPYRYYRY